MLTFLSRTSIFETLNFISEIKSVLYGSLQSKFKMGATLKYIFCIFSLIFRKSFSDFIWLYNLYLHVKSYLILEICLLSALFQSRDMTATVTFINEQRSNNNHKGVINYFVQFRTITILIRL